MTGKAKSAVATVKQSDLLKNNAIFFIGTMVISIFNYLYYPVLSRMVSVSAFGEIQAVISLFMQLGIVLTAYGYIITNIVANTHGKMDTKTIRSLLRLEQMMFILTIVLIPILFLSVYYLGGVFKFNSIISIVLVGVLILINIPSTTRTYILQGERKLKQVSIGGAIFAIGKLIITMGLVYAVTNSVVAAVLSYIIAQLLSLWYLHACTRSEYVSIKHMMNLKVLRKASEAKSLFKKYSKYGIFIFVVLSGLALLYSSDTILARLFFSDHEAGLYSGISSVARIIYFVTASVAGVLIASVRLKEKSAVNRKVLFGSLGLVSVVGLVGVLAFSLAPSFFVKILVGGGYVAVASWLPLLAIVMFVCSLNNLLAIYQIALRRYWAVVPVAAGLAVMVFGLFFVATVQDFIHILLIANLSVAVLLFIQILGRK